VTNEAGHVSPGLGRKVLVVDDNGIQGKLVAVQLEQAGFIVQTALGAQEALRKAEQQTPDAVVSDVLMDDMDGFSFCRTLRRHPTLRGVPVVLLSAYFDEVADKALAREVGANALVERSPCMHACVEAIVHGLAQGAPSSIPASADALYGQRLAHRLFRMQNESARAQAHFQALFQHANDAISLVAQDGVVLDVNKKWSEITGRPREDLIGLLVRDFSRTEDAASNADRYSNAAARSAHREGPVPIRRADGTTILMEFSTATVDLDGTPRVLAIGRDVTSLVESRRHLEASERRYRTLVENVPDVFWSIRVSDCKRTFLSANVERMCGFTAEEMLSGVIGGPYARVHLDDLECIQDAVTRALTTGAPLDEELRWQHRDGRWLWVHCRAVAVHDEEGHQSFEGVLTDVTARKTFEAQLARAQKVEAIGQLTAGIAHDFNNVLSVILAGSEFLVSALGNGENQEVATEIVDAALRGADLTARLLGFARSRAGRVRRTNVDELVRGISPMLARAVGGTVTLSVVPSVALAEIDADCAEIEQVLVNLAINARDAMPCGGTLTIRTANTVVGVEDAGRGGKPEQGSYVVVSVTDTGTGMDDATRRRIFEPFFTTKADKGTGLGLSTSYGIVRRHGGHISVDSALGTGTTFDLYFPLAPAVAKRSERSDLAATHGVPA
jgi:PAS domain S-box-containing protein